VVVTRLPEVPVHVEAYASPEAVREEEFAPAYALAPHTPLIISADDEYAKRLSSRLDAHITTYGFDESAQVRLDGGEVFAEEGVPVGMRASVSVGEGGPHDVHARGALGTQQLYAPAAALALALALGATTKEALKGLEAYVPPPGRARLLRGIRGSVLVDDSYNASPAAVEEALASLALVPGKRRIAILGDMLELGRFSAEEHEHIGTHAARVVDVVIAVGARARGIYDAARAAGKSEHDVLYFPDAVTAVDSIRDFVQKGDVVLIKASQSIRAERLVEALLENPADASLLVRQDPEWKSR
jgi:UDP-N-acetylmuramoyl-tripeptide--D-alanyl-D-alanine ligase